MWDSEADAALKNRQTIDAARLVAGPASEELLALLQELRPWANETRVATRLRGWANRHWGENSLSPSDADGADEVAQVLHDFGQDPDPPDDRTVLALASAMLRRVARKRPPTGADPITDNVKGYPLSTTTRWRKIARDAAPNGIDDGGLSVAFERIQRELDLDGLIRKGYTRPNAWAWLERNRGKHASSAPPPRRRRLNSISTE
jgi:hypothetical protein